jgi:hypothetical protein
VYVSHAVRRSEPTLELLADGLNGGSAGAGDAIVLLVHVLQCWWERCRLRSGTAEVRVDTSEDLSVVGLDVLDDNAAGNAVLAVTALPKQLVRIVKLYLVCYA